MTEPGPLPSYRNYQQQLDDAYGALGTHDYFQSTRSRHLNRIVDELAQTRGPLSIMEIGVGLGTTLRSLTEGHMRVGIEPDPGLLAQANDRAGLNIVRASGTHTPFADSAFDLVYMINVLHHMSPDTIERTLREVHRTLKPGGRIVVFEHNAYNLPVCFFLKAFVKIDRDAAFLTPARARRLIARAGLAPGRPMYVLFFPRFLAFLRATERFLWWLPLGGGYCVTADRG